MSIYRLMLTPYIFPLQITIILLAGLIGSSRILLNRHTIGQVGAVVKSEIADMTCFVEDKYA